MRLIVLALILLTACGAPQPQSSTPTPSAPATTLTMDKFNKVQSGMTLAQAEAILGKGTLQSATESELGKFENYVWQENYAKTIVLTFTNGKVGAKTQSGL